jgi:hypothetical protein
MHLSFLGTTLFATEKHRSFTRQQWVMFTNSVACRFSFIMKL